MESQVNIAISGNTVQAIRLCCHGRTLAAIKVGTRVANAKTDREARSTLAVAPLRSE